MSLASVADFILFSGRGSVSNSIWFRICPGNWPSGAILRDNKTGLAAFCEVRAAGKPQHSSLALGLSLNLKSKWVWLKIKQEGQTAGFGPCFHLPGFHFGTGLLSHRQMTNVLVFLGHRSRDVAVREATATAGWHGRRTLRFLSFTDARLMLARCVLAVR